MKIKLSEDVIVDIFPDENNCIGCHRINCPNDPRFCYNDCKVDKRGLGGSYYSIEKVEDLIIM